MRKLKDNRQGFALVESLLIVVIIALISFVGWYVYHAMKNTNNTYNSATKTSNSNSPKFGTKKSTASSTKTSNATSSWTAVKSPDGSFTFKIPPSWVSLTCQNSGGSASAVYIASSQGRLASCQSDNVDEASLTKTADNSAAAAPQRQGTDQSFSSERFTANGVRGYRATEVTSADDAILPNTKIITYSFYTSGKSFYASYRQPQGAANDAVTFEQIVQTWQF